MPTRQITPGDYVGFMTPVANQPPERRALSPLENGDRLSAHEFLRRYEAMPEVKKAELINGVVYMPSPVRLTQHAAPDNLLQTWLGVYAARTPGLQAASNATTRLGPEDVPQPDALLRILPNVPALLAHDASGVLDTLERGLKDASHKAFITTLGR